MFPELCLQVQDEPFRRILLLVLFGRSLLQKRNFFVEGPAKDILKYYQKLVKNHTGSKPTKFIGHIITLGP